MDNEIIVINIAKSIYKAYIERVKHQLLYRKYSDDLDYLDPIQKDERYHTARFALKCIENRFDRESCSILIHNDWITRNMKRATTLQKQTYVLLSEYEKNKYRNIYDITLNHYNSYIESITYIS
tara:strand:+ start:2509 stop:2880 length:372 start_codon:yes stop_codon:yes gene_type:complete